MHVLYNISLLLPIFDAFTHHCSRFEEIGVDCQVENSARCKDSEHKIAYSGCGQLRTWTSNANHISPETFNATDTYEIVTVIISFLTANSHLYFIITIVPSCLQKVLREKLTLNVEIVSGAL